MKEVTYKCAQCGNEMVLRHDLDEKPHPVVNCVKCRAGFKVDLRDMLRQHIGMFPIAEKPEEQTEWGQICQAQ